MDSPPMSSLILTLTGTPPPLLTPSIDVLLVTLGGLRYQCMTLVPSLLHVLGMWSCTLMPYPACMLFNLSLVSCLGLITPRPLPLVTLLTSLINGLLLNAHLSLKSTRKWRGCTPLSGLICPLIRKLMREAAEPRFQWRVSVALITLQPLLI